MAVRRPRKVVKDTMQRAEGAKRTKMKAGEEEERRKAKQNEPFFPPLQAALHKVKNAKPGRWIGLAHMVSRY